MEPYLGEIKLMAISFPPKGWHLCDGTLMQISQNAALNSLLSTYYGGDGRTTFALPDLRGRVPVHNGYYQPIGSKGGSETATLTAQQLPLHIHQVAVYPGAGDSKAGQGNHIAAPVTNDVTHAPLNLYATGDPISIAAATVGATGSSAPIDIRQPYLALNYFIAITGVYPPRPN